MPPGLPEQEAGRGPEATAPAAGRGQRSRPDPFLRPASWSHPEEPLAREKMRPCSALWAQKKQRVTALRGRGPGPRSACPGSPFCILTVGQHSRTGQAQAPRQRLLPHKAQTPGGSRHVLHSQSHLCSLAPWELAPGQPTSAARCRPCHPDTVSRTTLGFVGFPELTAQCGGRATPGDAWNTRPDGGSERRAQGAAERGDGLGDVWAGPRHLAQGQRARPRPPAPQQRQN